MLSIPCKHDESMQIQCASKGPGASIMQCRIGVISSELLKHGPFSFCKFVMLVMLFLLIYSSIGFKRIRSFSIGNSIKIVCEIEICKSISPKTILLTLLNDFFTEFSMIVIVIV